MGLAGLHFAGDTPVFFRDPAGNAEGIKLRSLVPGRSVRQNGHGDPVFLQHVKHVGKSRLQSDLPDTVFKAALKGKGLVRRDLLPEILQRTGDPENVGFLDRDLSVLRIVKNLISVAAPGLKYLFPGQKEMGLEHFPAGCHKGLASDIERIIRIEADHRLRGRGFGGRTGRVGIMHGTVVPFRTESVKQYVLYRVFPGMSRKSSSSDVSVFHPCPIR